MWISSDQTELHQAHRTASRIAEQFRLTLESIGDGVIATDSEERITLLNPIAVQMTGYTIEEAKGKNSMKYSISSAILTAAKWSPR